MDAMSAHESSQKPSHNQDNSTCMFKTEGSVEKGPTVNTDASYVANNVTTDSSYMDNNVTTDSSYMDNNVTTDSSYVDNNVTTDSSFVDINESKVQQRVNSDVSNDDFPIAKEGSLSSCDKVIGGSYNETGPDDNEMTLRDSDNNEVSGAVLGSLGGSPDSLAVNRHVDNSNDNAEMLIKHIHLSKADGAAGDNRAESSKSENSNKEIDEMKQKASGKDKIFRGNSSDLLELGISTSEELSHQIHADSETSDTVLEPVFAEDTGPYAGVYSANKSVESVAKSKNEREIKQNVRTGNSSRLDNADSDNSLQAKAVDDTFVNKDECATTASTQSLDEVTDKSVKYKCLKCLQVMKDKKHIKNHSCGNETDDGLVKITIMQDKNTKQMICKECDYSSSGHSFEEHLMCHLIERPYQCLYCKECFINRKEISRHVLKSHNGAKMSCALRALKKAKAIIKELVASGTVSFMAKVSGKVPLEKDHNKNKKPECPNTDQKMTQDAPSGHIPVNDKEAKMVKVYKNSESLDSQETGNELIQIKEPNSSEINKAKPESDTETAQDLDAKQSCGGLGLKIVASFSLKDVDSLNNESEKTWDEDITQPNFIMASPEDKEKQQEEVLSFLGPERPEFEDREISCSPMLPPPPLQPAPFHSMANSYQPHIMKQGQKDSNFFICSFNCQFSCLGTIEFQEHTTNFHSREPFFSCYYCGHHSPNVTDLVRHISNHAQTHNKLSPLFVCGNSGCSFGTNMVGDYIGHIKASHSNIPELLCYSCGDVFLDVSMLQAHVEDNVIHIVNCPHCPSISTDRKTILNHISSAHPGKAKMVSVSNQLICHDKKMNSYIQGAPLQELLPPALTPAPVFAAGSSVIDQILSRHDLTVDTSGSSLVNVLTPGSKKSPSPRRMSSSFGQKETMPESGKSPNSESSDFDSVKVKEEIDGDADIFGDSSNISEARGAYIVDENGVRRRIYVPMSERQAENYRCRHCTFIARDLRRMHCHERSHGMPPTKKERFKCMFCPQGFDSELKFRMHITCHPGLIKFLLYRCKKCEFDTNQKHTIIRHITCNRDRKHRNSGPVEDNFTVMSRSLESRVLECERCDYMTRHKIHMTIHYQRKHNILKDKGEFTIESGIPTDTPVLSRDSPYKSTSSPASYSHLQSPDSSHDSVFDFTRPSTSSGFSKPKDRAVIESPVLSAKQITERNKSFNRMVSQQAALKPGHVEENQIRKFKCPICKYLLPKAADLKNHVKRHSEIGQITLVIVRCKYCSYMSTARQLIYKHLAEKHPGKPITLVKKIVVINTTEVDKSFAETSTIESLDELEESLHQEMMSNTCGNGQETHSYSSNDNLFVLPEGEEDFDTPLMCPKCSYSSSNKHEIVEHIRSLHAEVKVIGSDEDVDKLARAMSKGVRQGAKSSDSDRGIQEEVMILPDEQIFDEPALCSRCDFMTNSRKEMVTHLQQNHPEISIMGRNSYPIQVSAMGELSGLADESCVVGSESLDSKLKCLYENYGSEMKCLICGAHRPKKFFIHVHILRHLNIYLWMCTFCPHRGLQKYKMVDHIKKIHPGRPMSVRYLRVNVEAKVSQFLSDIGVIKNQKAGFDESGYGPFLNAVTDHSEQAIIDGGRSVLRSPAQGGNTGCSSPHSLGSDDLDEKIACLYDNIGGLYYRCRACSNQFQRKFAIHRHIIASHLKVALLSCGYCGMEGVERHWLVDHILVCHKPAPINILPLDIDLEQVVTAFLTRMAGRSDDTDDTEDGNKRKGFSYDGSEMSFMKKTPTFKNRKPKFGLTGKLLNSLNFRFGKKGTNSGGGKKSSIVDPDVVMLGRNALDKKLTCLYQPRPSGQFRCLVCRWEFPRKYPLHRHIMLRHLKMYLVGCPYCPFEGIEKYTVSTHIKEEHKDKPISIKFTQPDVESRVRQFVDDMASIGGKNGDLIQKPKSKEQLPVLVVPKIEKSDEDEKESDNADEDSMSSHKTSNSGLVVAMFGKKRKPSVDDFVVKTEIDDDNIEEGSSLYGNGDDKEEEMVEVEKEESDKDNDEASKDNSPAASEFSPFKRHLANLYMTKYSRSPAGGKAKAIDVVTKIKVLKAKEGSVIKFYCEKCKFTSLHRSNIVRHIYKIHEKYQTHTCPLCSYQTLSLILMQSHKEKAHVGTGSKGALLNEEFSTNKPVLGPRSYQKQRQSLLGKKSATRTIFSSSSSSNKGSGLGSKQYACAYCHYETGTQEDILHHTRNNHSKSDGTSSGMKSSPVSAAADKPEDQFSACWDGSKKAVKRRLQDDSMESFKRKRRFIFEKGNELIQCGHCEMKETSMSRMQDHMTWDHPGLTFQAKQIPAWRFVCKSCSVKTMATSKMKYHLNRHINYRPYTCLSCGAFFPSPDQCRRHSRSQGHEEQYTYVRNLKKEARVDELLEGTRQLALKVQDEAAKSPDFDISQTDSFISKFQESRTNLRRRPSAVNFKQKRKAKETTANAEDESVGIEGEPLIKQYGKSPQTLGVEQDITIKCYNCDFTSSNVSSVSIHHKAMHPGKKFLWTELERGFTCDSTGEALIDCDSMPGVSSDVGYTTRMTLASGNNTMRFKCKTCDFSSCVIQAMKSHLKSHQPKGFVCPYCSRSFSGKEKLMRHQYCLHKGQALWVIHLRRSGVAGAISVTRRKSVSLADSDATVKIEATSQSDEQLEQDLESKADLPDQTDLSSTTFLCSKCSYASESLYKFRLHLAQEHEEFKHKIHDSSDDSPLKCSYCPYQAENETDLAAHTEGHLSLQIFMCGYCDYSACDRSDTESHLESSHGSLDPKIIVSNGDKSKNRKELPLIVNMKPHVTVERIPESVLNQYGYPKSDYSVCSSDEAECSESDDCARSSFDKELNNKLNDLIPSVTENMAANSASAVFDDMSSNNTSDVNSYHDGYLESRKSLAVDIGVFDNENDNNGKKTAENTGSESNLPTSGFNVLDDDSFGALDSEADMVILQFSGNLDDEEDNLTSEDRDSSRIENNNGDLDGTTQFQQPDGSSAFCSKDPTLLAAQEKDSGDDDDDDDDDEDDVVTFDNSVILSSPLPMISLGDGMSMSPADIDNNVDSD